MNWINAKENHFVTITNNDDGSYEWVEKNNCPSKPFLVAVETNKGWDINQVILTEDGVKIWSDGHEEYYEWDITMIDFWMEIKEPVKQ